MSERYGRLIPSLIIVGTLHATIITVALLIQERTTLAQDPGAWGFWLLALPMTLVPNVGAGLLVVWAIWAIVRRLQASTRPPQPSDAAPAAAPSAVYHSRPVLIATGALLMLAAVLGAMAPFSILLLFGAPLLLVAGVALIVLGIVRGGVVPPDDGTTLRAGLHGLAAAGGLGAVILGIHLGRIVAPLPELLALQSPLLLTALAAFGSAWALMRFGGARRDHAGLAAALTVAVAVTAFAVFWFYVAWSDAGA